MTDLSEFSGINKKGGLELNSRMNLLLVGQSILGEEIVPMANIIRDSSTSKRLVLLVKAENI